MQRIARAEGHGETRFPHAPAYGEGLQRSTPSRPPFSGFPHLSQMPHPQSQRAQAEEEGEAADIGHSSDED